MVGLNDGLLDRGRGGRDEREKSDGDELEHSYLSARESKKGGRCE